ncbi:unnamed protein product [Acanthoscelides obtectus]|uniref:Uncharacterized protein n=1 Tax=Acanthoscelides obtectus TaxID=200917 RepID=A0A9P0VTD6_ACAOB|nr:unnamed protein product [Acanthoscelides obtectus]CAH2019739.1 unnamed protein product [Acanthoscelides obtectus]CAK1675935.1 hypothetical protein AOBTE_LOCUS30498 [Acanthoscelides obtectus]CAK1689504.1 hypothetical protein AOBTE_LOCUS37309 [Acanthoscelides obtectus]
MLSKVYPWAQRIPLGSVQIEFWTPDVGSCYSLVFFNDESEFVVENIHAPRSLPLGPKNAPRKCAN